MRDRFLVLAAVLAVILSGVPANAEQYPDHPIRLVVPFPPGGVNDAIGRPFAEKMKGLLGTIVVENQGGSGGSLAAAAVARAKPDGYTILLGGGASHVFNPIAASRPLYDPIKDFEPISILAITGIGIAVHPSVPAQTLGQLLDHIRANRGKLSYGSAGVGSTAHLAGELLKSLTATPDLVHIPYKGAGPAITDLISGHIPIATPNVTGQVIELHRSGALRMLAVTTPARLAAAPEIPTAIEAGVPGLVVQNFTGLFVPAGTPKTITNRIAEATMTAMLDGEFQRTLIASGFEPVQSNPEKAKQFIEQELARWTPIIKSMGLKFD